jgi:hypothetical protein
MTRWTLTNALATIRAFQFKALQLGYHLALAGGVLNKGQSEKDLDIVVLPLDGQNQYKERLLAAAEAAFGAPKSISEFVVRYSNDVDLLFYPARVQCESQNTLLEAPETELFIHTSASLINVYE